MMLINGRCRYFNGLLNVSCEAGVIYLDAATPTDHDNPRHNIINRIPCFFAPGTSCTMRDKPTDQEIADQELTIQSWIKNITVTRAAIIQAITEADNLDVSCRGNIACPVCGSGTVSWSYAGSFNKHVHAQCSTAGCVQWIE